MVFGVIGHIPGDEADYPVGECGARIFKHVGDKGASPMLCEQVEPQKRKTSRQRHEPDYEDLWLEP